MVAKTVKSITKVVDTVFVRTVRGVQSFRRAGIEFTREPQLLPGSLSKARLTAIKDEPRLEFVDNVGE